MEKHKAAEIDPVKKIDAQNEALKKLMESMEKKKTETKKKNSTSIKN